MVSWTTVRFDHLAKWVIISTRRPAIIDPDVSDLLKRVELDPLLTDATMASLYRADEPLRFLKGLYFSDTDMSPYLYLKADCNELGLRSIIGLWMPIPKISDRR